MLQEPPRVFQQGTTIADGKSRKGERARELKIIKTNISKIIDNCNLEASVNINKKN
jgi:hypothetical protein